MLSRTSIQAIPAIGEIIAAYTDWSPSDYASALGATFWAVAILLPMRGDRRDYLAAATYVAFSLALAVAVIVAVPGKIPGANNFHTQLLFTFSVIVLATARWFMARRPQSVKTVTDVATDTPAQRPPKEQKNG